MVAASSSAENAGSAHSRATAAAPPIKRPAAASLCRCTLQIFRFYQRRGRGPVNHLVAGSSPARGARESKARSFIDRAFLLFSLAGGLSDIFTVVIAVYLCQGKKCCDDQGAVNDP